MAIKAIVLLCCCLIAGTEALQCLQCVNVEVEGGSSSLLKSKLEGKSDEKCGSPSIVDNPTSVSCDSGQTCGLVETEATVKVLIMGDVTFKMQARGCMESPSSIVTAPTCYDGNDDVAGAVKGVLNVFLALSYDTTVDGRVCYCNTDLCAAGGCGDGKVGMMGYCMEWYYWALIAVGGLVSVLLLTCCCCCCCACCRSNKTRGTVLQVAPQPQAVIVTTANGVGGIENPGYTQMIQK